VEAGDGRPSSPSRVFKVVPLSSREMSSIWFRSYSGLTTCTTQRRKENGEEESIEGRNKEVGVAVEDGDCGLMPRKWLSG
jgi:hypothetical protein